MVKDSSQTLVFKTWKAQTVAAAIAVVSAVIIPQLVHLIGSVSGLGTSLGETLLPMHLSIFLVGMLAGPWAGLASGLISPVLSFALTGMPRAAMLPFMVAELGIYGLTSGLLAKTKLNCFVSLVISQFAGRAVRALAVIIGVYAFGSAVNVSTIWTSLSAGILGIALQWIIIPLVMFRVRAAGSRE
ncbi:MAG: ECF transporter S component [Corallococcus sp.]|nr:ECF transporter S component [Corallococcus sp.]